jgi:hypothetical protein
MYGMSHFSL